MNTALILLVPIMETLIFNSRESMSITMKQPEVDMSHVLSSWILSQEPWTPSVQDLSVNSLDLTTSSSVKLVLVTTGLRVTTQRVLNWLTLFWMLFVRRLNHVTACKVSNSHTHWVVVLAQVWVLC